MPQAVTPRKFALWGNDWSDLKVPAGLVVAMFDNSLYSALNNNEILKEAVGLLAASAHNDEEVEYISEGRITKADWTLIAETELLTPNATYWLHTSPGRITPTRPDHPVEYIVKIGVAIDEHTLELDIEAPLAPQTP